MITFSSLFSRFRSNSALKRLNSTVATINALEPELSTLSNDQLMARFQELRSNKSAETQTTLGFAIVRELSKRVLGLRPFDVQLIGGLSLLQGRLAEMRTGEGKTLTISGPASIQALKGNGVHVVTANSYLAKRDALEMKPLYEALGLTVSFIHSGMSTEEKRLAYLCDITYGVGSDFGFDYLRDNLVLQESHKMQRPLYCAIVDEVDSILIDEARTPLIISGESSQLDEIIEGVDQLVKRLKVKEHFELNAKDNVAVLTEKGYEVVESGLTRTGLIEAGSNLYSASNLHLVRRVHSAVTAYGLFKKDKDYLVHEGEVVLIDQGTGRTMPGRRLEDGLHEAIEAKEGLSIQMGTETKATITYQNYFKLYHHLSGLTGTAMTEAEEFIEFYDLEPVVIPTNKPVIRKDYADVIFINKAQKFTAAAAEIASRQRKGQPVLVGCASVRDAEALSSLLRNNGIVHEVLTAKHIEREALIIANAGRKHAVTVTTNMAGRGTDIALGGELAKLPSEEELRLQLGPNSSTEEFLSLKESYLAQAAQDKEAREAERQEVLALGGLYVLGLERDGIRRVDNQLAGRAGRQGDPGEVQFFLSLKDPLLWSFSSSKKFTTLSAMLGDDATGISGSALSSLITTAQARVENQGYEARRQLMQFDSVLANQREAVYDLRNHLMKDGSAAFFENAVETAVSYWSQLNLDESVLPEQWDASRIKRQFERDFGESVGIIGWIHVDDLERDEIISRLIDAVYVKFSGKNLEESDKVTLVLKTIGALWTEHLTALEELRQGVGLKGHSGQNPVYVYHKEAFELFEAFSSALTLEVIKSIVAPEPVAFSSKPTKRELEQAARAKVDAVFNERPISRNEPCPCESGKKFKQCHGKITARV